MQLFHRNRKDSPPERRGACRYQAVEEGAWLGWWRGGTFRARPARLVDVSLQGSLILADDLPERDQPVWVHLRTPESVEWVASSLVQAHRTKRGPYEARLVFQETCPYDFFKTAVYGRDALAGPIFSPPDPRSRGNGVAVGLAPSRPRTPR